MITHTIENYAVTSSDVYSQALVISENVRYKIEWGKGQIQHYLYSMRVGTNVETETSCKERGQRPKG